MKALFLVSLMAASAVYAQTSKPAEPPKPAPQQLSATETIALQKFAQDGAQLGREYSAIEADIENNQCWLHARSSIGFRDDHSVQNETRAEAAAKATACAEKVIHKLWRKPGGHRERGSGEMFPAPLFWGD